MTPQHDDPDDPEAARTALLAVAGIVLVVLGLVTGGRVPQAVAWGLAGLGSVLFLGGVLWGALHPGDREPPSREPPTADGGR